MGQYDFQQKAKYWNEWACQSVKLIKETLKNKQGDTDSDEPRLRSYYILLSYAFELMIKSRLVAITGITEDSLRRTYKHKVGKILKKLKDLGELEKIKIKSLPKEEAKYIYSIETTNDITFYIHDFTNIRYYPQNHKYSWDKESVIFNTAKVILDISNKIRELGEQS